MLKYMLPEIREVRLNYLHANHHHLTTCKRGRRDLNPQPPDRQSDPIDVKPVDAEPLRARLERRGVNNERGLRPSQELRKKADHIWKIREGSLANSQLPDIILGSNISKPVSWNGGLIPKYLFEMKNLDSGAIFPMPTGRAK